MKMKEEYFITVGNHILIELYKHLLHQCFVKNDSLTFHQVLFKITKFLVVFLVFLIFRKLNIKCVNVFFAKYLKKNIRYFLFWHHYSE